MRATRFSLVLALVWLAGLAPSASAQVTEGTIEGLGFAGVISDGGGATFGGGIQYAVTPRWLVAAEGGYLTGGNDFSAPGVDVDSHGISVDVNAHYLFTTDLKFTPYVLGGLGYLRATASTTVAGFSTSLSASSTGLNLGGGLRWQTSSGWGVRPELKIFVADGSNVRLSVGIYKQF